MFHYRFQCSQHPEPRIKQDAQESPFLVLGFCCPGALKFMNADFNAARLVEPKPRIKGHLGFLFLVAGAPGAFRKYANQISLQPGPRNREPRMKSSGILVLGSWGPGALK